MINNVTSASAVNATSRVTATTTGNAATADLLSNLTPQDWAVGSAMAGQTLDHDPGTPKPLGLFLIAQDRASGRLPADQALTPSYLRNMAGGQNEGFIEGINRAIAYLQNNGISTANATDASVDLLA